MGADVSGGADKVRWRERPLGVAIIAGLVCGLLSIGGSWLTVSLANQNALEVVTRSADKAVAFQQKQLEQSMQDAAFLAFIDATQELSRKVSDRLGQKDLSLLNAWYKAQGPDELGLIPFVANVEPGSSNMGPPPPKSEDELWQAVNETKNKLQIVCSPNELSLIDALTTSLTVQDVIYGTPEVAPLPGAGGTPKVKEPKPAAQLPTFMVSYEQAHLALVNAYRHDVLNLEPLPAPSSSPSPPS